MHCFSEQQKVQTMHLLQWHANQANSDVAFTQWDTMQLEAFDAEALTCCPLPCANG